VHTCLCVCDTGVRVCDTFMFVISAHLSVCVCDTGVISAHLCLCVTQVCV